MKGTILVVVGLVAAVGLPIGVHCAKEGTDWLVKQVNINGNEKKKIYLDGGGEIHNFNSTVSLKESKSNPYPYNTLEVLCNEWAALPGHEGYEVIVNKTSSKGSRDTLLPQLQSKTAPSIIFQNGTNVNTDLNRGYYLDVTKYLDSINPYYTVDGVAQKWSAIYNENELSSTQASDGKYYYIAMEKQPVCLAYNKTLLARAGVDNPQDISTYGQWMNAMKKVQDYKNSIGDQSIGVYDTNYQWFSIALESSLYSDELALGDILNPNGKISTEELCRLYNKGIYQPKVDNAKFHTYIQMIHDVNEYIVGQNNPGTAWLNGNLAFREATGAELSSMIKAYDPETAGYEWDIIPFPSLSNEDYALSHKEVVRGVSGLTTAYWVSNRAMADGTAEACVDLLMFLTAPAQNNRMIGDLKCGIPLNPTDPENQMNSYAKKMYDIYEKDLQDYAKGTKVGFDSFNSWGVMGETYKTSFTKAIMCMEGGYAKAGNTVDVTIQGLSTIFNDSYNSCLKSYNYDQSKW